MRGPFSFLRLGKKYSNRLASHTLHPTGIARWRPYSTLPIISPQQDEVKVKVKVGSSGSVSLRYGLLSESFISPSLKNPRIRHQPRPSNKGPIILYLPSGLPNTLTHQQHDPLKTLALSAHATIVHIGYRLSQKEPYPKPIHDILASYDWILKHLVPTNHHDPPRAPHPPGLGVCGELTGGSLAAMLALTECQVKNPSIRAAALGNPVGDWSAPFHAPNSHPHDDFDREVVAVRERCFATPHH
ncbi:MAG: hypothetical protein Q9196_005791, partial [Gyalolechia fulgens]